MESAFPETTQLKEMFIFQTVLIHLLTESWTITP